MEPIVDRNTLTRQPTKASRLVKVMRSTPSLAVFSLIFVAVVLMAIFAPWVAPHDPEVGVFTARLVPPAWIEGGDSQYLLGTDELGRDLLSRMIWGARVSLLVGFVSLIIGGCLGSLLGLAAGFFGGKVDTVIMGLADVQLSFPVILFALTVIAVVGPSQRNLIIVIGIGSWVTYARVARASTLAIRQREFVEAVRSIGGSEFRIMFRHILPNALSALIVVASLDLARIIVLESTLSFLGLGVQPPTPSWGAILNTGRQYMISGQWWVTALPGLILTITVISVSRIGDWVRDRLDPTSRH